MSTAKLATITIKAMVNTDAVTTGRSLAEMASISNLPNPGQPKMTSATVAPFMKPASSAPNKVTMEIEAFFNTWV